MKQRKKPENWADKFAEYYLQQTNPPKFERQRTERTRKRTPEELEQEIAGYESLLVNYKCRLAFITEYAVLEKDNKLTYEELALTEGVDIDIDAENEVRQKITEIENLIEELKEEPVLQPKKSLAA